MTHRVGAIAAVGACVVLGYAALTAQRAVLRSGSDPTAAPYWHLKGEGWGRPAADATTVYFLSKDHRVLAIDAGTGTIRWQRPTGGSGPNPNGATVLVSGQNVVAGDYDIFAFDRMTGAPRWRFAPANGYGAGIYLGSTVGGRIYAGSPSGRVYAIDGASGAPRWTAVVADDQRTVVYEPIADEDLVVAGYTVSTAPNGGGIVAFDATTGSERWRTAFPRPSNGSLGTNAAGNPLLIDDTVVAATGYGFIYCFDRTDGSIRWSIPKLSGLPADYLVSPDFDFRPLARTGRLLFAGSLTGFVTAYDIDTRREVWRRAGPRYISVAFNISSDDQSVYAPYLGGNLVAFDAVTGVERWRTGEAAGAFSFPVLPAGHRLFVASSASGFYALRR